MPLRRLADVKVSAVGLHLRILKLQEGLIGQFDPPTPPDTDHVVSPNDHPPGTQPVLSGWFGRVRDVPCLVPVSLPIPARRIRKTLSRPKWKGCGGLRGQFQWST